MAYSDPRRVAPRVSLDGFCGVVSHDSVRHASLSDLSALGVRLGRPFDPERARRRVQLEVELPNTDEIVWAYGDVVFARLTPMGGTHENGHPRFWCEAGIALKGISDSERRMLRDYVIESRRELTYVGGAEDGMPIYWDEKPIRHSVPRAF